MSTNTALFGPYRLESLLGRGGMGEVYRAWDTEQERVVAVKRLAPHLAGDNEFRTRFRREARSVVGLRNPHIVPIHRFGEIEGQLYIDMRHVDGGSLEMALRSNGPLPLERSVTILEQIAGALDEAHTNGLVHRDVKPSNILLDGGVADFAYLADFGIIRTTTISRTTSLTPTGAIIGSLAYMAPEQFNGAVTGKSDVYSLACVFYELLTGTTPYGGEGLPTLMHAHLALPPPMPSEKSPAAAIFDDVIRTGMAKNVTERFDTAGELARAARAALQSRRSPPTASNSPPGPPPHATRAPTMPGKGAPVPRRPLASTYQGPPTGDGSPTATTVPIARGLPIPRAPGPRPSVARTTQVRRRWLLVASAVTVLAVVASVGVWSALRGADARAGDRIDPAVPPATTAAPAAPPNGPVLTEAVFTGRTSDGAVTLAVGFKNGRAAGYLCDGQRVEAWLEGTLTGTHLTLSGKNPSNTVDVPAANANSLTGYVTISGKRLPFAAQIATSPAGLYESRGAIPGIADRIGWIVLPDGSQVGILDRGNSVEPAPPLNTSTLSAVVDDQTVEAHRISGESDVVG